MKMCTLGMKPIDIKGLTGEKSGEKENDELNPSEYNISKSRV